MANLTIKKLEPSVITRLKARASASKLSLNSYLKATLAHLAGVEPGVETFQDLDHLAGTWTKEQEAEFAVAITPFEAIDKDMW